MRELDKKSRATLLVFCFVICSSFRCIWNDTSQDQSIEIPPLEYLANPELYYTPNPQDPKGDWILFEPYYECVRNRIWVPHTPSNGEEMTVYPTNDWLQPLACWPQQDKNGVIQARSTTGHYVLSWNGPASSGLHFECPTTFAYYSEPSTTFGGHFTLDSKLHGAFSILPPKSSSNPIIEWAPTQTGNMLRVVDYSNQALRLYIVQGGVFQGAHYNECPVDILIDDGGTFETTQVSGMTRHVITGPKGSDGNQYSYLVYTPEETVLEWCGNHLTSSSPYTGYLNVACIPTASLACVMDLLDEHASAVIVNANGSFSSSSQDPYDYSLNYTCVDLLENGQAPAPLLLLMNHHLNKAELVSGQEATPLSIPTLKGVLKAFAGNAFEFQFPAKYDRLTTNPLPSPNLTKDQALALINHGILDSGLQDATEAPAPVLSVPYNKFIYQKALTLAYATEVIQISGEANRWETDLDNLRKSLIEGLDNVWKGSASFQVILNGKAVDFPTGMRLDRNWGTVVFYPDSYGSAQDLNDHIVQYGYIIYSLILLDQYEQQAGIAERYLDQMSKISPYTNRDLGTLLVADIGQCGGDNFVMHRNLDFYEGHSWLSGLENSLDGQNIESESEALFGSMSVLAWLEHHNASDELQQIAMNRWKLETTAYESYWHVDPSTSPYEAVCPEYVSKHLTASIIWQHKIDSSSYLGLEWDRLIGAIFMPTAANLLDNYLGNPSESDPITPNAYAEAIASLINTNWDNYDTSNPIQSILISLVARSAQDPGVPPLGLPGSVQDKIDDLKKWKTPTFNPVDPGTNAFLLSVIGLYAQNRLQGITP